MPQRSGKNDFCNPFPVGVAALITNFFREVEDCAFLYKGVNQSLAMAAKYPQKLFMRLSEEDRERLNKISEKAEIPPSTLARKVLRQWLREHEFLKEDKKQPQDRTLQQLKEAC